MAARIAVCVGVTRSDTAHDLIASLLAQTLDDWEAVLVCQRGATVEIDDPRVTVLHSDRQGRSAALNDARAAATAPLLAMTDDDCEVAPDWLEVACRVFDADPDLGVLGGTAVAPPKTTPITACPEAYGVRQTFTYSIDGPEYPGDLRIIGANTIIRADLFDELCGLDERFGAGTQYPAAEDLDLLIRAKFADAKMGFEPDLVVHHTHGRRNGFRAVARHHRGYARGGGAYLAFIEPTGLEDMPFRVLPRNWRTKRAIRHLATLPFAYAGYRRFKHEGDFRAWAEVASAT